MDFDVIKELYELMLELVKEEYQESETVRLGMQLHMAEQAVIKKVTKLVSRFSWNKLAEHQENINKTLYE